MHFGASVFKMATARIRNEEWQQDDDLKDMLARYVKENLRRREIFDFVCRVYLFGLWTDDLSILKSGTLTVTLTLGRSKLP